jgi:hypothetical protein
MKEYNFIPDGRPKAGFYADFGHSLTDNLKVFLNKVFKECKNDDFIVKIDGAKLWRNYQIDNHSVIDYYKELFQIDYDFHLKLPLEGKLKDHWTNVPKENFESFNKLLKKYFKMSESQHELYEKIIKKYNFEPKNTIGILYRGTDKYTERKPAPLSLFINKTKELLSENPNSKIFIQTDQLQVKDEFVKAFPDNCFFIQELPQVANKVVPHKHDDIDKYMLAKHIEIAVRMLSQCKFLILSYSNVSTFIGAYRNDSKNVFQY